MGSTNKEPPWRARLIRKTQIYRVTYPVGSRRTNRVTRRSTRRSPSRSPSRSPRRSPRRRSPRRRRFGVARRIRKEDIRRVSRNAGISRTRPRSPPPTHKAKEIRIMNVEAVRYAQSDIKQYFSDGKSLENLIQELCRGDKDPMLDEFLMLETLSFGEKTYTFNNRRLHCLKAYQQRTNKTVMIRVKYNPYPEEKEEHFLEFAKDPLAQSFLSLFSTTCNGEDIRVRGLPRSRHRSRSPARARSASRLKPRPPDSPPPDRSQRDQSVESSRSESYTLGETVEMKRRGGSWFEGVVTSVDPLRVRYFWEQDDQGREWCDVRKLGVIATCKPNAEVRKPWTCQCGFRNVARNTKCGGNGPKGCNAPREQAEVLIMQATPKASAKPGPRPPSTPPPDSMMTAGDTMSPRPRKRPLPPITPPPLCFDKGIGGDSADQEDMAMPTKRMPQNPYKDYVKSPRIFSTDPLAEFYNESRGLPAKELPQSQVPLLALPAPPEPPPPPPPPPAPPRPPSPPRTSELDEFFQASLDKTVAEERARHRLESQEKMEDPPPLPPSPRREPADLPPPPPAPPKISLPESAEPNTADMQAQPRSNSLISKLLQDAGTRDTIRKASNSKAAFMMGDRIVASESIAYGMWVVPVHSSGTIVAIEPDLGVKWDDFSNLSNAVVSPEQIQDRRQHFEEKLQKKHQAEETKRLEEEEQRQRFVETRQNISKAEEARRLIEEHKKKVEEEVQKKNEECERARKEHAGVVAIIRAVNNYTHAPFAEHEKFKDELDQARLQHFENCGSQKDRVTSKIDEAIADMKQRITKREEVSVLKLRAEIEKYRGVSYENHDEIKAALDRVAPLLLVDCGSQKDKMVAELEALTFATKRRIDRQKDENRAVFIIRREMQKCRETPLEQIDERRKDFSKVVRQLLDSCGSQRSKVLDEVKAHIHATEQRRKSALENKAKRQAEAIQIEHVVEKAETQKTEVAVPTRKKTPPRPPPGPPPDFLLEQEACYEPAESEANAQTPDQPGIYLQPETEDTSEETAIDDSVKVVTFQPGPVGIGHVDGLITNIAPSSQAQRHGVEIGWKISAVGGRVCNSFEDDEFSKARHGGEPYQVKFMQACTVVTFKPGPVGIRLDPNGNEDRVANVLETGQAFAARVQAGWRIVAVGRKSFTKEAFKNASEGNSPYTVTFDKAPTSSSSPDQRSVAQPTSGTKIIPLTPAKILPVPSMATKVESAYAVQDEEIETVELDEENDDRRTQELKLGCWYRIAYDIHYDEFSIPAGEFGKVQNIDSDGDAELYFPAGMKEGMIADAELNWNNGRGYDCRWILKNDHSLLEEVVKQAGGSKLNAARQPFFRGKWKDETPST